MKINVNTDSIFQLLLKNYFRVNLKIGQKRYFMLIFVHSGWKF
jgi:hypothetical protein